MISALFNELKIGQTIDETYEHMDIENLFGWGISLDDLTDYNLACALDKLLEGGCTKSSPRFACGLSATNRSP